MKYAKDGITVAPIQDSRRPTKEGLYPVKIRVTYQRRQMYYPTGKTLSISDWEKLPTTKSQALAYIRKDIENSYNTVRVAVEELSYSGAFSFDNLNKRLKSGAGDNLNTMFKAKIEELRQSGQVGTMAVYDNALKGIVRFAGERVRVEVVTPNWLRKYEDFLRSEGKAQTTISIHLRQIRSILNDAVRCGLIRMAQYPFGKGRYEIQSGEGRKMALTLEKIGEIARYDDGTEATAKYRDYWLFLYLCNGINVADFVKLRYRNIVDGEICYIRQKTERTSKTRKEIRVTVTDAMQRIIDKWGTPRHLDGYIFPIITGTEDPLRLKNKTKHLTRAINRRMSEIGGNLGVGNISTYTARHSFATVLKRAGANIAYISESLGHQDLKTTENYLASFEREERQKNAELLTAF